jgi:hypothetical protein
MLDILLAEGIAPPPALPSKTLTPISETLQEVPGRVRSRSRSCKASSSARDPPSVKEEETGEETDDQSEDELLDDELQELRVGTSQHGASHPLY